MFFFVNENYYHIGCDNDVGFLSCSGGTNSSKHCVELAGHLVVDWGKLNETFRGISERVMALPG